MKVAINGFGRIGRSAFRILDQRSDVEVVAINDVFDDAALMYLLRYDTVMGPFKGPLALEDGCLVTAHGRTRMLSVKDPTALAVEGARRRRGDRGHRQVQDAASSSRSTSRRVPRAWC